MYCIKSIISYWYHKTDTSIISKWQINDTFNDTFYDDINKDRASFYIIFTSFGKLWSLNSITLYAEYTKGQKIFFLMVLYHIVSYEYRFVSIGIVSYHNK